MARRPREKNRGRFWGFMPYEFMKSSAIKELHSDARSVLLNLQAQKNGYRDHDDCIPWGYTDGPFPMRKECVSRGLFTLIRLGVIERVEGSVLHDGKYRKPRYKISEKWAKYDPENPGKFLLESPFVQPRWKSFFTKDGEWVSGVDPNLAPSKKRSTPKLRREKSLVRPSNSDDALSVRRSDADTKLASAVGPKRGPTQPATQVRGADALIDNHTRIPDPRVRDLVENLVDHMRVSH